MDRSHLAVPGSVPTPDRPRQVEIKEIEPLRMEVRDQVRTLTMVLQVIEKISGVDAPFANQEVVIKVDQQERGKVLTDETGLVDQKISLGDVSGEVLLIAVPGTVAFLRKKIAEITTRDFDEEKRLGDEKRKADEVAKVKAEKELAIKQMEAPKLECRKIILLLYSAFFSHALHYHMNVRRRLIFEKELIEVSEGLSESKRKIDEGQRMVAEYKKLWDELYETDIPKLNRLHDRLEDARKEGNTGVNIQSIRNEISKEKSRIETKERRIQKIEQDAQKIKKEIHFYALQTDGICSPVREYGLWLEQQVIPRYRHISHIWNRTEYSMAQLPPNNELEPIVSEWKKEADEIRLQIGSNTSLQNFFPRSLTLAAGRAKSGSLTKDMLEYECSSLKDASQSANPEDSWNRFLHLIPKLLEAPVESTDFYKRFAGDIERIKAFINQGGFTK